MKPFAVRLPEELMEWIRKKAAMESIKQKKQVSMNSIIVEILSKEMESERKQGE